MAGGAVPAQRRKPSSAGVSLWVALLLTACTSGSPGTETRSPAETASPTASRISCPPAPAYSAPDPERPIYLMRIRLVPTQHLVIGAMRVTFTPDLATDRLVFRLWPNGPTQGAEGAHLSVDAVRSSGHALQVQRPDPTTLVVVPPRGELAAGESLSVSMRWRLTVPDNVADRLSQSRSSIRLGSFFPILGWEPGIGWATDRPTKLLAETSTSPTADFHVTVSAPAGMRVVATGTQVADDEWRADAVRDFAIAAGDLRLSSRVIHIPKALSVTVAVGAGSRVSGRPLIDRIERTLTDLARLYGPYPWDAFTLVITDDLGGNGLEYPNLVFEGSEGVDRATTHELAHQWFYSLVGNDPARDPWLDEALASWAGARTGGYLDYFLQQLIPISIGDHVGSPMSYWDHHGKEYQDGVYVSGVQALASLGPIRLVDCALRLYVARSAYGIATPEDLLSALERVFPDAEQALAPFGIGNA